MTTPYIKSQTAVHNLLKALGGTDFAAMRIAYDGNLNAEYIGLAEPGTLDATALWMIRKLTYDVNNNVTEIKFAAGRAEFANAWTGHAALSYV